MKLLLQIFLTQLIIWVSITQGGAVSVVPAALLALLEIAECITFYVDYPMIDTSVSLLQLNNRLAWFTQCCVALGASLMVVASELDPSYAILAGDVMTLGLALPIVVKTIDQLGWLGSARDAQEYRRPETEHGSSQVVVVKGEAIEMQTTPNRTAPQGVIEVDPRPPPTKGPASAVGDRGQGTVRKFKFDKKKRGGPDVDRPVEVRERRKLAEREAAARQEARNNNTDSTHDSS